MWEINKTVDAGVFRQKCMFFHKGTEQILSKFEVEGVYQQIPHSPMSNKICINYLSRIGGGKDCDA